MPKPVTAIVPQASDAHNFTKRVAPTIYETVAPTALSRIKILTEIYEGPQFACYVAPTVFMLEKILTEIIVLINTYRLTQKKFTTATLTATNRPLTTRNCKYERGHHGNNQRKRIGI